VNSARKQALPLIKKLKIIKGNRRSRRSPPSSRTAAAISKNSEKFPMAPKKSTPIMGIESSLVACRSRAI